MRERPIPFSAPMVRAVLAGTKTQTRRVVKPHASDDCFVVVNEGKGWWPFRSDDGESSVYTDRNGNWMEEAISCPYGQPGDRLYVRHAPDLFPVYFKPIAGWEGLYSAGTDGLIYRVDRGGPSPLAGSPSSKGYLTVALSRGQWETHAVHKLVCETFYGPAPFDGAQVRHMDGNQLNNRPENLDWGTQADNWQDRKAHGRGMGEQHHSAKLTPGMVEAIRTSKLSQRALAREYGVSQATIWEAKNGITWGTHAPGERNLPAFRMWRSSIHMPRWASRITLEVTGVRVERLQDISAEDCIAEGIVSTLRGHDAACDLRDQYRALWEQINGSGSWALNPFVWVTEFGRIDGLP